MTDLNTKYMGVPLRTPLVVAACSISSYTDRIVKAEEAGAGALVIRSLFEEQIALEALRMQEALTAGADSFAEALSFFPSVKHGGADEHLRWVEKARAAVKMPLFGSLNAVSPGAWVRYARRMEQTGVDGLELNLYAVAADPGKPGLAIERELFDVVESVRREVKIPLAVKLSPFYTSVAHVAAELDQRGVQALVLFNRFLQPDIDPETEALRSEMVYSTPEEIKLPLRWIALLHGRVKADLALSTGAHSGRDVVKALLAGATVVQTAAALIQNGIPYMSTMILQLEEWMTQHGYQKLEDFRGKLSQKKADDPSVFERAQYVRLLMSQK